MGKVIICFLVSILLLAGFCGIGYYGYTHPREMDTDVKVTSSTYSEDTQTSTLTCEVTIKNKNYDFGLTATDFSYIICFKGAKDKTLHEVLVEPNAIIEKENYTAEFTFADGQLYDAVPGEVKKVEIRMVDASYENASKYRVENGGEKYDTKLIWLIGYTLATFLFLFTFCISVATNSDGGFFKTIFQYAMLIFYGICAYTTFFQGPMVILTTFLP